MDKGNLIQVVVYATPVVIAVACSVFGYFWKRRKQRQDAELEAAMRDGFRRLAQDGELDRTWRIS